MSRPVILASLASLLALLGACTTSSSDEGTSAPSPSSSSSGTPSDGAQIAQSTVARETSPLVAPADSKTLTSDNTAFAADLYRTLRTSPDFDKKSIFFSPHSISVALAMTYAGARGTTETEMASALHYSLPQDRLHPAFDQLDLALSSRGSNAKSTQAGVPFKLNVTSSLWGLPKMPFEQPFLDTLSQSYGAGIRLTDFASDPEGSRKTINGWVSNETATRISELLPANSVTNLTRLVLVNAVYFNAAWAEPFEPAITKDGTFHGLNGDVSASFMAETKYLGHTRGDGFDAVSIPYDGKELELVAILPDAGQFDAVEGRLDGAMLESVAASLEVKEVEVHLPKFSIKGSSFSLRSALRSLGMNSAFSQTDADLTGILPKTVDALYIGDVLHDSFLTVDEKGTEAAAATAVLVAGGGIPTNTVKVTMDRPFIFGIRDIATGAFVFLGRVAQP